MPSVFLTTQLKIHNPSRRKRAILASTMRVYTLAYKRLLDLAKEKETEIESVCRYKDTVSAKLIAGYLSRLFKPHAHLFPMHTSLKDSLFEDVAQTLAGYFELKERAEQDKDVSAPSWPQAPDLGKDESMLLGEYGSLLDNLREAETTDEVHRIEMQIRRTLKVQKPVPPLFARPDGNVRCRNFGLYYEPKTDTFWVRLFLLDGHDPRRRPLKGHKRCLLAVHDETPEADFSSRPASHLLLPLECGTWQREKFLRPALENPRMVRTARLCRKGDDFYLHVTFEYPCPPPVQPRTVLALVVDRRPLVEVSVTDLEGTEITQAVVPGDMWWREQRRQREVRREIQRRGKNCDFSFKGVNDNIMHLVANEIVDLAQTYKSQVVILDSRPSVAPPQTVARKREAMNYVLHRRPYGRLRQLLEYKLPLAGLPEPKTVYPWQGMLKECVVCGRSAAENGAVCACGHRVDFTQERALKVARKWLDIAKSGG